tara:strand:+ start:374 stop:664 length:291 start_codon:yes stop_codon:yes gene_type:complete
MGQTQRLVAEPLLAVVVVVRSTTLKDKTAEALAVAVGMTQEVQLLKLQITAELVTATMEVALALQELLLVVAVQPPLAVTVNKAVQLVTVVTVIPG